MSFIESSHCGVAASLGVLQMQRNYNAWVMPKVNKNVATIFALVERSAVIACVSSRPPFPGTN
jgi:hypothetical protein